jgi:hypothetical protein
MMTTCAPCAAINLAVEKPSPLGPAPPVIKATLPFNSIFVSIFKLMAEVPPLQFVKF